VVASNHSFPRPCTCHVIMLAMRRDELWPSWNKALATVPFQWHSRICRCSHVGSASVTDPCGFGMHTSVAGATSDVWEAVGLQQLVSPLVRRYNQVAEQVLRGPTSSCKAYTQTRMDRPASTLSQLPGQSPHTLRTCINFSKGAIRQGACILVNRTSVCSSPKKC
jgi:hypothetical protein